MAYFVYKGDVKDMVAFGLPFDGKEPTEVTDKKVIKKLQGNSHFEEVSEPKNSGGNGDAGQKTDLPRAVHKGRGKWDVIGVDGAVVPNGDNLEKQDAIDLVEKLKAEAEA